jgi:hypothetical protein
MRKLMLLITSILVVCLASGFVSLHSQQQRDYWRHEVPTPVVDGVLTDRQKEHSKLYETYENGKNIRDELIQKGGLERFRIVCGAFLTLPDLVTELAEKADAIVIATFVSKSSQITSGGTYIFTDYDLRIEQVLKDVNRDPLRPDAIITVTRPGGKVLLFGKLASITDFDYKPLTAGRRYLLFLRYLPSTAAYEAVSHASSFDITEAGVETLSEAALRPFETDLPRFITSVNLAITNNQKNGRTQ